VYIAVKKLRKSVNICLSYQKNKSVSFFMAHSVESESAFSFNNFYLPETSQSPC